ncbi:MAG: DUF86 domain-containing protein [Bacteroidota bacterium]
MKRDIRVFLQDIVDSIEKLEQYTELVAEPEFYVDTEKQDAIIRRIEIIGEAVANLPMELRDKFPDVPWRDMVGMRNVMIHNYFGVTLAMVWRVASSDLPKLKERIIEVQKSL